MAATFCTTCNNKCGAAFEFEPSIARIRFQCRQCSHETPGTLPCLVAQTGDSGRKSIRAMDAIAYTRLPMLEQGNNVFVSTQIDRLKAFS